MSVQTDPILTVVDFAPFEASLTLALRRLAQQDVHEGWSCRRLVYVAAKSETPTGVAARNLDALTPDLHKLRNMALAGCSDRHPRAIIESAYFVAGFKALALRDIAATLTDGWLLLDAGGLSAADLVGLVKTADPVAVRWFDTTPEPVALMSLHGGHWVDSSRRLADAYLTGRMWGLSSQSFTTGLAAVVAD